MSSDDFGHVHESMSGDSTGHDPASLAALGWQPCFAQQTSAEALSATPPARVVAVHRSGLQILGVGIDETLPPRADATDGDWLLLDRTRPRASSIPRGCSAGASCWRRTASTQRVLPSVGPKTAPSARWSNGW
ncbi:MAG: hypothetical protein K9L88_14615 [Chromatiaceae bacterium]|nr:hypothetical protein [Chromatiaceae bacterium]